MNKKRKYNYGDYVVFTLHKDIQCTARFLYYNQKNGLCKISILDYRSSAVKLLTERIEVEESTLCLYKEFVDKKNLNNDRYP